MFSGTRKWLKSENEVSTNAPPHNVRKGDLAQRQVKIPNRARQATQAPAIVVGHEVWQVCVAVLAIGNPAQAQLLHEPILQRLVSALDAALGGGSLRRFTG